MSQPEAAKALVSPLSMLDSEVAEFHFPPSTDSTRNRDVSLTPPKGTQKVTIAVQDFDLQYTNHEQFGFGQLQVRLAATNTLASCTVTLRDNNVNKRQWEGTVRGIVTFYGV